MKPVYRFSVVLPLIIGLALCSACSKNGGVSLARSKDQKDISECLTLLKQKKNNKAIQCLEAYKSRHYGQATASLAELSVADAYFQKKDYLVAGEAYEIFIQSNPSSDRVPYAYYRGGLSYLKASPKAVDRDQSHLDDSVRMLQTVVSYFKSSEYAAEAQTAYNEARLKQAKQQFYIGRFYYRDKEYLAAAPRFETVVTEFSKLGLDEESFYYLIKSLRHVNQNDVADKYLEIFREGYPESRHVKRLK